MQWELFDGQSVHGPFEEEQVLRSIRQGLVPAKTMARRVGMPNWEGLRAHAPFAMALEEALSATAEPEPPAAAPSPPQDFGGPAVPPGQVWADLKRWWLVNAISSEPAAATPAAQPVQQQQGSSGCSTGFWVAAWIFVLFPLLCIGSCIVCAGASNLK